MLLKVSGEYAEDSALRYHFDSIDLTLDPDPDEVETPGGYGFEFPYGGVTEDGALTLLVRYTIDLAGQTSLLTQSRQATLLLDDLVCNDMTESVREVAKTCGVSESKVKMSLHRTRKKLRAFLQEEGLWQ